jgi:hypothetical protein
MLAIQQIFSVQQRFKQSANLSFYEWLNQNAKFLYLLTPRKSSRLYGYGFRMLKGLTELCWFIPTGGTSWVQIQSGIKSLKLRKSYMKRFPISEGAFFLHGLQYLYE